jgi:hypothetical protein
MFIRNLPTLTLLVIAAGLIGSNAWRFSTAEPKIAMSEHLNFLPEPEVARAMSLGHTNTLAKLRWIDSFKYFQYQIDARDDQVFGGDSRGVFERLYDLLVGMDAKFDQFYYHASLTLSGINQEHGVALRFLSRGIHENPHDPLMWTNLVSHLKAFFDLEERQPEQMEALLKNWAESVNPEYRSIPESWLAAMALRQSRGDAQIDYWLARLQGLKADSPEADMVRGILREQIARWHVDLLSRADYQARTGDEVPTYSGMRVDHSHLPVEGISPYGPVDPASCRICFDPWGLPYVHDPEQGVVSLGLARKRLMKRGLLRDAVSLSDEVPLGLVIHGEAGAVEVEVQVPQQEPWSFGD